MKKAILSLLLLMFNQLQASEELLPLKKLHKKKALEKRISKFIPKGSSFFKFEKGNLNHDGIEDALLVYEKKNGNRSLLILLGENNQTYKLKAQNENIVYSAEASGIKRDSFFRINIDNGYFSVEHMGGDRKIWIVKTTFKYIVKENNWFLHEEMSDTLELQANTCLLKETENYLKTVKDFGVVSFEGYNN